MIELLSFRLERVHRENVVGGSVFSLLELFLLILGQHLQGSMSYDEGKSLNYIQMALLDMVIQQAENRAMEITRELL